MIRPLKSIHLLPLMGIVWGVSLLSAQPLSTSTDREAAVGSRGMVATAHPLASSAAAEILRRGGNAVDAAVAAAFAIGVVEPDGSGLGGGGGMLVYSARTREASYVNYYPRAGSLAKRTGFQGRADSRSAKAILVPGTVAGLLLALERYGTLPLPVVIAPAIRLAEQGFPIDATLASIILDHVDFLQQDSATASLYVRDGFPLTEGDTLCQPALAHTLRSVAASGRAGFYAGSLAETMVRGINAAGGLMTPGDFSAYTAEILPPVRQTYRGREVISAPPPHSGAMVIEALNILENTDLRALGHFAESGESLHLLAETLRRVYADRTAFLADPQFETVPLTGLLSKEFARTRFRDIHRDAAVPREYRKTSAGNPGAFETKLPADTGVSHPKEPVRIEELDGAPEPPHGQRSPGGGEPGVDGGGHTTHLGVIDQEGNVVSLTQTLGTFFGSGVTVSGVLMNNAMSNFSTTSSRNSIEPGKQPRSSISPTIILKDGAPLLSVGSPGATRIIATVVQLIVNVVDYELPAAAANRAPRILCQKADDFLHLESRIPASVRADLERRGHTLKVYGDFDLFFGGAQIILRDPMTGLLHGSADPRRGGVAIGY